MYWNREFRIQKSRNSVRRYAVSRHDENSCDENGSNGRGIRCNKSPNS